MYLAQSLSRVICERQDVGKVRRHLVFCVCCGFLRDKMEQSATKVQRMRDSDMDILLSDLLNNDLIWLVKYRALGPSSINPNSFYTKYYRKLGFKKYPKYIKYVLLMWLSKHKLKTIDCADTNR